jgi:glyoxylase-like metal-dependent hydrolase (beta-lactamase superfamily II)
MVNYTIRQIQTGWQYLDKGMYGTYGKGYGEIIEHPVFCWLLEGGGRKILVDTGMSDTEHSVKYHHDGKQEPGQAIHEQLAKLGIGVEEIEIIIFTHLHWDHCYNVEKFTKARLYASEIEYRFALDPIPFYWNSYEAPALGIGSPLDGMHFSLTRGEEEIVEGIRVYPIPGHSPGHIAVAVQTEKGIYSLIGDLILLRECLQPYKEKGWPFTPPGRFYNIVEIWHSIEEVLRRSDHILMTHDPESSDMAVFP